MFAFTQQGHQLWNTDFAGLGSLLPTLPTTGAYAAFSKPFGNPAGPMTITNGVLLDPMNVGYQYTLQGVAQLIPIPILSALVAIDPNSGHVKDVLGYEIHSAGANTPVDAATPDVLAHTRRSPPPAPGRHRLSTRCYSRTGCSSCRPRVGWNSCARQPHEIRRYPQP